LKSEFTRDSIRRFASIYFGVKLDLYGSIAVDEDTQDEIMTSLRQAVAKRQQAYKDKIRKDIIKAINTNAIDGKISTGVNADDLIKELDDPYSSHLTGNDNRIFQQILDGSISGIGVSVFKTTESYITIANVFTDSPAMNAGIQASDRIIKIGDHTITSEDKLQDLISQIQ
jgi:C-terminal processing protease CtpA/Prc